MGLLRSLIVVVPGDLLIVLFNMDIVLSVSYCESTSRITLVSVTWCVASYVCYKISVLFS